MTNKDLEHYRGSKQELQFYVAGDITSRKIRFVVKTDRSLTTARLVEKQNTADGGSDSEISQLASGIYTVITVTLLPADTEAIAGGDYYYDLETEDASDDTDRDTPYWGEFRLLEDVRSIYDGGTPPVPQALSLVKGIIWEMVNGTITKLASSGWTADPVATHNAGVVTITSSGNELLDAMTFDSNNNDYNIQQWSAAQAKIGWASTSGTIRFWINYYN